VAAQRRAAPEAEGPLAVVARERRAGPRPHMASVLPRVLHRTRDQILERAAGMGKAEGQASRAGRPLDVVGPRRLRATASGARGGRGP
jgi:hypothetical protein